MRPRVFRSKGAWVLGWVWLAFAALNTADLVSRGRLPSALVAGAVLGVLTVIIYLTCLRPGIFLRDDGILVRNPLRDAFIPWTAVDDIRATHAIVITSGDRTVRSWTPQASTRERAKATRRGTTPVPGAPKAQQAAAEALAGRTHADWVAEQVIEEARRSRARDSDNAATLALTWSPPALAAIAAALLLVAAAVVVAL